MSKAITRERALRLFGVFLNNVDFNVVSDEFVEWVLQNPVEAGAWLTACLKNGSHAGFGNLTVRTAPFDPVKFIGKGWSIITKEQDARSNILVEVDFSAVDFLTCLKDGETSITGEEKLSRLKDSSRIRYGASVFHGLWLDYQARGENSALERLYCEKKITSLDFLGDVLQCPDGYRYVLYLHRIGAGWSWSANWLAYGWRGADVSVVSQVAS